MTYGTSDLLISGGLFSEGWPRKKIMLCRGGGGGVTR